jgi:2-oxoisovalerate dehydrogenase E1 component
MSERVPGQLSPVAALEAMTHIRRFEEAVLAQTVAGALDGSVHLCLGQEAIPVGAVSALEDGDRVVATYRGHGWALALGSEPDRVMAEIHHRATGLNGGRAGSPLLSDPSVGLMGENSIVGAGVPIAAGLALAARTLGEDRVVLVSIGDGAMNQGSVTEAMVFAASRSLPVIIVCENNGWSEMTRTSVLLRAQPLSARAQALGIDAMEVDGNDPFSVRDAIAEAAARCRAGAGPVFVDCLTHRLGGHYNRDIEHYRPAADRQEAKAADPLVRLVGAAGVAAAEAAELEARVVAKVAASVAFAVGSPMPDASSALEHVVASAPKAAEPAPTGDTTELTTQMAINTALRERLEADEKLLVFGEDVGHAGGIFGVTRGLQKTFGPDRVFDTPIAEAAILGAAVGAGMGGVATVAEIMWADFLFVAADQLMNQAANVRYINRSELSAPLTIRLQQGATPGSCAQHSQSIEAILAHIPGISVGLPASPEDAYAMTRAAIADPDPTVLVEHRSQYQISGPVRLGGVIQPAAGARWRRRGDASSIVTWGAMVNVCLAASEALASEGIEVGVLDLRWLRPLDDAALDEAVQASGGLLVVAHEAVRQGGFGAEVVARITDRHFARLAGPVRRVAAEEVRIPASAVLQRAVLPQVDSVVRAVRDGIREATSGESLR